MQKRPASLLVFAILLATASYAFQATGTGIDLNAYWADAGGIAAASGIDLNFILSDGQPTGQFSATSGGAYYDLNLGTDFYTPVRAFCGDNFCDSDESCSICSADCGACSTPSPGGTTSVSGTGDAGGGGGGGGGGSGGGGGGPSTPAESGKKPRLDILDAPKLVAVTQGSFESFTLIVKNTGELGISGIKISEDGLAPAWFSSQQEKTSLEIGESMPVVVKIAVPEDAKVKAYHFFIMAKSDTAKNGAEVALKVLESSGPAAAGNVFRDVGVSNAIVNQEGIIRATVTNPTGVQATFFVSLDVPEGVVVREKEIEVTLQPGEERELSFHFTSPGKSGLVKAGLTVRGGEAGAPGGVLYTKSFFVIINKLQAAEGGETGLVSAASTVDVAVSAVFFAVLTGLVIAFFATAKGLFMFGRR